MTTNIEIKSSVTGEYIDTLGNKIENDITCKYLNSLGFYWPDLTIEYIEKLINYMISINFLK